MRSMKNLLLVIAIGIALVFIVVKTINVTDEKIEFVKVLSTTKDIKANEKIDEDDIKYIEIPKDLSDPYLKDANEIINKYAKNNLYKEQLIMMQNIKKASSESKDPSYREVNLKTDISSATVGKGDFVDVIYVGRVDTYDTYGKIMLENIEVKAILNKSGKDLETLSLDKYNKAELEPGFIVVEMSQKNALDLETLQGTSNNIVFKFIKYTEGSENQEGELAPVSQAQIITR